MCIRDSPDKDPQIYASVANQVMESLKRNAYDGSGQPLDAAVMRELEAIEREMRLGAITEARIEIFRLARENKIPDHVCREWVSRYDLQEARMR